jgi:apolipoprotein N-acyltransferase
MRVLFRYQWMAIVICLGLGIPFLIDARHHILGSDMHVPRSLHLHRVRGLAPVILAMIAASAFAALCWTKNRYERWMCWSLVLWFVYEGIRFAVWVKTGFLLQGPWSWVFWIPALGFAIARAMELGRSDGVAKN